MLKNKILKALGENNLVDAKKLESFLGGLQQKKEADIINAVMESGIVSEDEFLAILSGAAEVPAIDVTRLSLDDDLMRIVTEKLIRRHLVLPLSKIGKSLTLVISNPTDVMAIDDVQAVAECEVEIVLASPGELRRVINSFYDSDKDDMSGIITEDDADIEVVGKHETGGALDVTEESTTAPIVKMVDLVISEAIKKRASDIHIEPQEKSLRIRYRIDGELHSAFDLPKGNQNALIARLKIMSNLDITETRIPQDGRFRVKLEKKEVDFRVSILPTAFGNKIVLRALDRANLSVGLETLGFLPGPLMDFKKALAHPFGIILVTGPTGSGKSTTLYSVLNEMNVPERNIVTVEDPVEYQVGGITQIAARQDIGLNFATGLRAILRQSPDIIMVGEIRDFETADIAIKASLTGQMVLSTLHTNDAVGSITRLVNMGIEPFLVASSLIMSCAQRLLRQICPYCKIPADIPDEEIKKLGETYPEILKADKFYRGKGCDRCNGTGYRGRLGTLETLLIDDELKNMINKNRPESELRDYLKKKGVKTLRDNAMLKFIAGGTTLEEVYRVT